MVVLCHLVGRTEYGWLTKYGYLGVAIFFVLSGFVITKNVGDRNISLSFLGRFAARRAIRLDPPYWASIFAVIVLAIIAGKQIPDVRSLFLHMFYMQDLLGVKAILNVYWTLCLEVQFYVFLILLLWIGQAFRGFWVLWALLYAASLIEQAGIVDLAPKGLFLPYWFAFALGAMAYWVTAGKLRAWSLGAAVVATLAMVPFKHGDWFLAASLTAVAVCVASHRKAMGVWLSDRVSQFLGRISYSLYLFHPIIGWAAMTVVMKYTGQLTALLVGIIASIVSAWIANITVERQSIRLSRLVGLDRPGVPATT